MKIALTNLLNDGYVAFAIMIIGKDSTITPMMIESSSKEATGRFLRMLSPHVDAIIIISEAWTLMEDDIDDLALTVPVSEHPKRVEGVFRSGSKESLRSTAVPTASPIVDDESNQNWTDAPVRSVGNFCNLFGSESPSPVDHRCE
eukprot:2109616-Prymnesium_polylepis.1